MQVGSVGSCSPSSALSRAGHAEKTNLLRCANLLRSSAAQVIRSRSTAPPSTKQTKHRTRPRPGPRAARCAARLRPTGDPAGSPAPSSATQIIGRSIAAHCKPASLPPCARGARPINSRARASARAVPRTGMARAARPLVLARSPARRPAPRYRRGRDLSRERTYVTVGALLARPVEARRVSISPPVGDSDGGGPAGRAPPPPVLLS